VLPATRQRWLSRLYPSRSWYMLARYSDPGGMQDWVDPGGCCITRGFTRELRSPILEITRECRGWEYIHYNYMLITYLKHRKRRGNYSHICSFGYRNRSESDPWLARTSGAKPLVSVTQEAFAIIHLFISRRCTFIPISGYCHDMLSVVCNASVLRQNNCK